MGNQDKIGIKPDKQKDSAEKSTYEFANSVLRHNFSLIEHVETKAHIVLGVVGIILTLLVGLSKRATGSPSSVVAYIGLVTYILLMISCVITALFSLKTIKPKIGFEEPPNHIYFLYVKAMERSEYISAFKKLSLDQIIKDILDEVYTLAHIQDMKYRTLDRAVKSLFITFLLLGVNAILFGSIR